MVAKVLAEISDPLDRLRRAQEALKELEAQHQAERAELRRLRGAAVRELLDQGYSLADVASEIGITRQQVFRLSHET